jgi:hypothetical protein
MPGRGARATRRDGETTGGLSERRAHRRGSFHGGATRPDWNGGEGRRPVVGVGSLWFEKVAGAQAVTRVAWTEREGSR